MKKNFLKKEELSLNVIKKAQLNKIVGGSYAESTKIDKPYVPPIKGL